MRRHLLLAYSWGFGHIGDTAITPGMLALLHRQQPDLPVQLLDVLAADHPRQRESEPYLHQYSANCRVNANPFQRLLQADRPESKAMRELIARWGEQTLLSFERGCLDSRRAAALADDLLDRLPRELFADLQREQPELAAAFAQAGFVLYSASTALSFGRLGVRHLWRRTLLRMMPLLLARTLGVPYGLNAQSFEALDWPIELLYRRLFGDARFLYCRDSDSLRFLRHKRLAVGGGGGGGFRADSTLFFEGRDDRRAEAYMAAHGLQAGQFIALMVRIPEVKPGADPIAGSFSERRLAAHMELNARFIERWIAETGRKVLLCHESPDTIESAKEHLWRRLSAEARERCVYLETFWTTEMAYSLYGRAQMLVGMEIHSVFLALNAGTPVLHHAFAEAGRKQEMLRDIGLHDWLFDADTCTAEQLLAAALRIHRNEAEARERLKRLLPRLADGANAMLPEVWSNWRTDDAIAGA
ncbi:polysaccharide pyruvyl transferase family protein [Paenibacillus cymbidii]|uniref:polysaccharide pyruvyl transferase family protein n=1 Tax=Paenibacillus cymbidii TaxID=1639034 RepID=UPI0010811783|nr:polysaccharide pyruvyl transferase family protein [Paenibacillus cymbidii]